MNLFTSISETGKRYRVVETVGGGGYAEVRKGFSEQDIAGNSPIAVKMHLVRNSLLERVKEVEREVSFLQRIQGPNAPFFLDHSFDALGPYIVMDYIPKTLAESLDATCGSRQPLLGEYLRNLPGMLELPYKEGISHCDLTTNNIGMRTERQFALLDWGFARNFGECLDLPPDHTMTFLAPEVREWGEIHATSDIYAAEKVIEEILIGEHVSPDQSTPQREAKATLYALKKIRDMYLTPLPCSLARLMLMMTAPAEKRPAPHDLYQLIGNVLDDFTKFDFFEPVKN